MTNLSLVTLAADDELFGPAVESRFLLGSELAAGFDGLGDRAWGEDVATLREGESYGDEADENTVMTMSDDPVRQYLDAAGRFPLLDAEQEADLAKRYQAGLAAEHLLARGARTTPKQRAALQAIRREGERAKERLIRHNLRLVVPQAKKWLGRDMDLIELIQEGNLGLIRAVEKFDHTKGYKFSTYAVWWIRQALQRGVSGKARTIRVPAHVWELSAKLRRAETNLRQKLGRDPSDQELAGEVKLPIERIHEVREALQQAGSLDRPVGEEGDATLGDLIPDENVRNPEASVSMQDARARVESVLADLDERERAIVDLRFGFTDGQPHTLAEIGERFGMSRERIRQLEKQALAKLRHPSKGEDLESLLEALAA